jgi:hypothetical protein
VDWIEVLFSRKDGLSQRMTVPTPSESAFSLASSVFFLTYLGFLHPILFSLRTPLPVVKSILAHFPPSFGPSSPSLSHSQQLSVLPTDITAVCFTSLREDVFAVS